MILSDLTKNSMLFFSIVIAIIAIIISIISITKYNSSKEGYATTDSGKRLLTTDVDGNLDTISIQNLLPSGSIIMWPPNKTIPTGWTYCGSPTDPNKGYISNLNNQCFAKGLWNGDITDKYVKGSSTITLTRNQLPKHNHDIWRTILRNSAVPSSEITSLPNCNNKSSSSDSNNGNVGRRAVLAINGVTKTTWNAGKNTFECAREKIDTSGWITSTDNQFSPDLSDPTIFDQGLGGQIYLPERTFNYVTYIVKL